MLIKLSSGMHESRASKSDPDGRTGEGSPSSTVQLLPQLSTQGIGIQNWRWTIPNTPCISAQLRCRLAAVMYSISLIVSSHPTSHWTWRRKGSPPSLVPKKKRRAKGKIKPVVTIRGVQLYMHVSGIWSVDSECESISQGAKKKLQMCTLLHLVHPILCEKKVNDTLMARDENG